MRDRTRRGAVLLVLFALPIVGCREADPPPADAVPNRPKVAGTFRLRTRQRPEIPAGSGRVRSLEKIVDWNVSETMIVVCDMWDDHYCKSAAIRVGVMAPRANEVLSTARDHGATIVHAPSGCMDKYAGTPYRQRMQQAKPARPPVAIAQWCHLDPTKEHPLPVDTSKCACDDPVVGPEVRKFSRQHPALDIAGYDGISDSGEEIYNFCVQEGIANVAILGVHANMCVLGRPFGIRQLTRLGLNVVLVRDLTDAMYDPRQPPFVSHARGTELIVEHIERFWCPSILSSDLTQVVPGSAGPAER